MKVHAVESYWRPGGFARIAESMCGLTVAERDVDERWHSKLPVSDNKKTVTCKSCNRCIKSRWRLSLWDGAMPIKQGGEL